VAVWPKFLLTNQFGFDRVSLGFNFFRKRFEKVSDLVGERIMAHEEVNSRWEKDFTG
jgi:hypothetical protein